MANNTTGQSQSAGGAIYTNSNVSITSSLFENNESNTMSNEAGGSGSGGALALNGVGRALAILDSSFIGNVASPSAISGNGGAVYQVCDNCILEVHRSYFRDNLAVTGAGIFAKKFGTGEPDVHLTLKNSSFVNNQATDAGGAAWTFRTKLSLLNNTFYNNDALRGAHVDFSSTGNSLVRVMGNLLAPTASGTACNGYAARPSPSLIKANLFSDGSCGGISATSLPNTPLGTITIDETPGQIGVVQFTGSAVIDSIADPAQCEPIDARSQQRPTDGDADGVADCDVGAYEHPYFFVFDDGFED